jgi:hypothetical protein
LADLTVDVMAHGLSPYWLARYNPFGNHVYLLTA